jgi:hypothetical protein
LLLTPPLCSSCKCITFEVLITLVSQPHGVICAGGFFEVSALEVEIAKGTIKAVAEASVAAISVSPHTCVAAGYVGATTSPV